MKKTTLFILFLILSSTGLACRESKQPQKLMFKGYFGKLAGKGKEVKFNLIENGLIVKSGRLSGDSLVLPPPKKVRRRLLFLEAPGEPPFLIRLKGDETTIATEKPATRLVRCDLSKYPDGTAVDWFLQEWDGIPFKLYPALHVEKSSATFLKVPAHKDVNVEIRYKGLLPAYGVIPSGRNSFQPSPPVTGWCREVRVTNQSGEWLKNCLAAFVKVPPSWSTKFPKGKASGADRYGRVVLKQAKLDEKGEVVILGAEWEPVYRFVGLPTGLPVTVTLEKGKKISGRVVDESGKPLHSIVSYRMAFDEPLLKEGVIVFDTAKDGSFQFGWPASPKGFSLTFCANGCRPLTFKAKDISSPLVVRLKKETPIRGRVEDKKGNPIAAAAIHFGDSVVHSDADGDFVLRNLMGVHSGWVEALGYFRRDFKIEHNRPLLKVVLYKGRIGITARLIDTEGKPVEEAMAAIEVRCGSSSGICRVPRKKCPEGIFNGSIGISFGNKCDLRADITLSAPGYVPLELKDIKVPSETIVDLGTLVFERGLAVTGRVWMEDGEPAVGAKVILVQIDEEKDQKVKDLRTLHDNRTRWTADTDTSGDFKIDGLVVGSYMLFIDYPEHPEFNEEIDVTESSSIGEFTLKKGVDLVVKVFSADGVPEENYLVRAFPSDDAFGVTHPLLPTAADGSVVFKGRKEGSYKIKVFNPQKELLIEDSMDLSRSNSVKEFYLKGESFKLTVTFNGDALADQVFYIAPKPATGGPIFVPSDGDYETLISGSTGKIFKARTDASGVFTLEFLDEGSYLLFSGDSPFQAVRSFNHTEDDSATVEVKGFTVSGSITTASGENIADRVVLLYTQPPAGPPVLQTRTDANGRYSFGNLEPGAYFILFNYAADRDHSTIPFRVENSNVTLAPVELEE